MRGLASVLGVAALACACLVPAAGDAGELLRCKGPDGKTLFTDDKSLCPDAEPFEPKGRLSGATAAPAALRTPKARALSSRARSDDAEAVERAEAERWRARRAEKENELVALAKQREALRGFVAVCNRRGRVVTFDDAGIKHEMSCKQVQKQYAALDDQEARVREYLDRGLAEECRRAGCLPGWIR